MSYVYVFLVFCVVVVISSAIGDSNSSSENTPTPKTAAITLFMTWIIYTHINMPLTSWKVLNITPASLHYSKICDFANLDLNINIILSKK